MKPEAQRIAIAKWCGFTQQQIKAFSIAERDNIMGVLFIPDYLNDLNAIHAAEKLLTPTQCNQYECLLGCFALAADGPEQRYFHKTAAQRAEALLKTIEKWVD